MNTILDTHNTVPDVLLDFLYDLIDRNSAINEIKLASNILGTGEVQDIICETANGSVFYRVFGFPPVNACLKVVNYEGQHELIAA